MRKDRFVNMRKDRFVLDNNIWISYFITQSEQKLIDIISYNDLVFFSCKELFEELERVLNYSHLQKFEINRGNALKIVKNITVIYKIKYPIKRYIPQDQDDDYLIALACRQIQALSLPEINIFFWRNLI